MQLLYISLVNDWTEEVTSHFIAGGPLVLSSIFSCHDKTACDRRRNGPLCFSLISLRSLLNQNETLLRQLSNRGLLPEINEEKPYDVRVLSNSRPNNKGNEKDLFSFLSLRLRVSLIFLTSDTMGGSLEKMIGETTKMDMELKEEGGKLFTLTTPVRKSKDRGRLQNTTKTYSAYC